MQRTIVLQTAATNFKKSLLSEFENKAVSETNNLLSERTKHSRFNEFWKAVGMETKRRSGFNVQVVCYLVRSVWSKQKECKWVKGTTVNFNVPRNCKTFFTKSLFFVELGIYPRNRIAIPIRKNTNFERFEKLLEAGWMCKTYGLTPRLEIAAYLSKEESELPQHGNVLGVDINSKCFALSVLSPEGKVLKQAYLGKDIWQRRKQIFERRSVLQSYADRGSSSAQKKLDRTKEQEHNFVKNRIGEVVRDITDVALKFDADISVENLKRFSPKGKKFNRQVMRIPFYAFKKNLEQRCFDRQIKLNMVDSWHTSKWCSHCGAVGKGHSANYSMFRCSECGQLVNSDRKASLAIAVKSLLERISPNAHSDKIQISNRRVPVNGLARRPDAIGNNVAVQFGFSTQWKSHEL